MSSVIVRPARPLDALAIATVHVASWRTTYQGIVPDSVLDSLSVEKRKSMWEKTIAEIEAGSTTQAVFVAEDSDKKVVGFVAGCKERGGHPVFDGELGAIYLYQDHQKHGIGHRLTLALAEKLQSLGYQRMMLWVLEKNPSRRFYESIGGRLLSETKEIDFDGCRCNEVAYGWDDLQTLIKGLSQSAMNVVMPFVFSKEPTAIRSRKTGRVYSLVCGDSISFDENVHTQIATVCDEPEVYDNVFAIIFKGKRYSVDNAKMFSKLVLDGWKNGTRFDWLILHEGAIVGTIGIKSLEGEIGYWQSNKHPGVMTLVAQQLSLLAKEAGFNSLWAYVKKTNTPSIKVLQRAGFMLDADLTAKREDALGFRINL